MYYVPIECTSRRVYTGLGDAVGDEAAAVASVLEVDLGLRGALDGDREPTGARLARVDDELGRLLHARRLQPGAHRAHLIRAACAHQRIRLSLIMVHTATNILSTGEVCSKGEGEHLR